jgi:predicted dehydrogenase
MSHEAPDTRRSFIKTSAAAAALAGPIALAPQSVLGANDRVNIGWIGVGTRGSAGLGWLHTAAPDDAKITAICDTYEGYIARAKDIMKTTWGNTPTTYTDYHKLLDDKSVDAVYIMTPEHLHHDMAIAALQAGKHVYVEKPLAHTIEEGFEIVKVWEQSGKVCQVGTQNRSSSLYKKAKELIQQGLIGDVHFVRAFWYRNGLPNEPSWRYVIPAEATPENTDWERFLGKATQRPWDPHRYFQWRLYWDYSGGISTDLLVHQTDIVNFMLDKTVPRSCMSSGGIYRWTAATDDRDVPDCLTSVYDYPDKFQLNYSCYLGNEFFGFGEEIFGNEGTIRVLNRQDLYFEHETYNSRRPGSPDRAPANIQARQPIHLNGRADFNEADGAINHFRNFIHAVQGKEKVIAPPPIGQQAAISGHLATLSYKNGKKILWDDKTNTYSFT